MVRWIRRTAEHPAQSRDEEGHPDGDLTAVFVVGWIASLAQVVLGLANHETFGGEGTLAFLYLIFVPMLLAKPWRHVVGWRRRAAAPEQRDPGRPGLQLVHPERPAGPHPASPHDNR